MDGKNSENIILLTLEIHTSTIRTVYHLKFYTKPNTFELKTIFLLYGYGDNPKNNKI
jgi:hypothetical protein